LSGKLAYHARYSFGRRSRGKVNIRTVRGCAQSGSGMRRRVRTSRCSRGIAVHFSKRTALVCRPHTATITNLAALQCAPLKSLHRMPCFEASTEPKPRNLGPHRLNFGFWLSNSPLLPIGSSPHGCFRAPDHLPHSGPPLVYRRMGPGSSRYTSLPFLTTHYLKPRDTVCNRALRPARSRC